MDVGLYTDGLSEFPFEQALDIAADAGVTAIEIAVGGQSKAPHLRVDELLASAAKRTAFAGAFRERGLRIAALNCSAWPLHPVDHAFHDGMITKAMRLAGELGVDKIVSMSGCTGDGPGASTINWVWFPWPDDSVAHGRRSWDAAVAYWQDRLPLAEQCGVARIALELHPLHVVYNVRTLLEFRAAVGDRRIGMNFDPSHLIWQMVDPVRVIQAAGDAIYHCHLKDTQVNEEWVALNGVLDNTPWTDPDHRAWVFSSAGRAHGFDWWHRVVTALREAGYDDVLSIEQEDPYVGQEEGVREVAAFAATLIAAA